MSDVDAAMAMGTLDTVSDGVRDGLAGLRLDGHAYWMVPGDVYAIRHDGLDWLVSGGVWRDARLTVGGQPVFRVPMTHGGEALWTGAEYQAHCTISGDWELWRVAG